MQKEKNKQIDFKNILLSAWKIARKNKYLWQFGFVLTVASFFPNMMILVDDERREMLGVSNFFWLENFLTKNFFKNENVLAIFLVTALIFSLARIVFQGALIFSIEKEIEKKKNNFKIGLKKGKIYFWSLFFFSLISEGIIFLAFFVLFFPVAILVSKGSYVGGIFLGFSALLIFISLVGLIFFLKKFGYLYLVLGKLNIRESMELAYALFRKNFWQSLWMGLNIFFLSLISICVFFIFTGFLTIFFLGLSLFFGFIFGKVIEFFIFGTVVFLFLLAGFFSISFFQVFLQTAWILFFHEVAKTKKPEMLEVEMAKDFSEKTLPLINSEHIDNR